MSVLYQEGGSSQFLKGMFSSVMTQIHGSEPHNVSAAQGATKVTP